MTHTAPPRVRFAPSPTGWLHVGNARTALYNWLFARHHGGTFILRIEDTDLDRSTADSAVGILESMRWLGLDWDEGPEAGGTCGPYRQSERLALYQAAALRLLEQGQAYHCFCTPEQLEADRQEALAHGRPPQYVGRCARLAAAEVAHRRAQGPGAIRFRVPREEVVVDDLIRGRVTFPAGEFGDFVILRTNGIPSYNFAVVVDDHAMGISHVIRGEDHLSNTPKQVFLYRALGYPPPAFAHLSMILGPDGTRLSKRHGATSVQQFMELGYLPEALLNYLALLGWSPGDDREVMPLEELTASFTLDRVSRSASTFDPGKLSWMNGVYLRTVPTARLFSLCRPFLTREPAVGPPGEVLHESYLLAVVELVKNHAHFLTDLPTLVAPYVRPTVTPTPEAEPYLHTEEARNIFRALSSRLEDRPPLNREEFVSMLKQVGKTLGLSGKNLFMPVRAALSGETHGPDLDRLYLTLGPVRAVDRLRRAAGEPPPR
jgi:nondiscriminating glutamyl-tRNA synthetase